MKYSHDNISKSTDKSVMIKYTDNNEAISYATCSSVATNMNKIFTSMIESFESYRSNLSNISGNRQITIFADREETDNEENND